MTKCSNEECDLCHPAKRFKISTERVQRIWHEREIKAATLEDAMRIYNEGTAWPSSYDDRHGEILEEHDPVVQEVPLSTEGWDCYLRLGGANGLDDVSVFASKGTDDSHE